MSKLTQFIEGIGGRAYLLGAILIFAASSSVARQLTQLGSQNLIDGRNPISFCNVLFVGNLCALISLIAIYGRQWNVNNLRKLSKSDWLSLLFVAFLSGTLAPALIFAALEETTVNNVIIIERIEPPLALALSIFLLKEKINRWVIVGAIVSFIGVVLAIVLQSPTETMVDMGGGLMIGKGELMAIGGAVSSAIANLISRVKLREISLGIFTVFRTAMGAVIFFVVATKLFGIIHFRDVLSPFVWQWMFIYGTVIVVIGQLLWFQGLKTTSASDVSMASSFSPLAAIIAAYLILGEVPTVAQYLGGSVIIIGILLNQIGISKQSRAMKINSGFKGI